MSNEKMRSNLGEFFAAAGLEFAKPGATLIVPWRMETKQGHADIGLDQCGCGFCPDDDQETT